MRRRNVEMLDKVFAQTATLGGALRQFPERTDLREVLIETLGLLQSVCRVLLDEEGEI